MGERVGGPGDGPKVIKDCFGGSDNPIDFIDSDGKKPIPWSMRRFTSLSKSDWWEYNSTTGLYDKNTFSSAAAYNTQNLNSSAYNSIYYRSQYYNWVQSKLNSTGSKWFEAASYVTTWKGVGAADNINLGVMSNSTEKMLRAGNQYLLEKNIVNAKEMINNKGRLTGSFLAADGEVVSFNGLNGMDLDFALVKFEQTQVQAFLSKYQSDNKINDANMNFMKDQVSSAMSLSTGHTREVMNEQFRGGKDFRFGNYSHRVRLGNAFNRNIITHRLLFLFC